ncbi:hypothetical protein A2U01_0078879, partial [Trifolium medium]|nr:hypothetical protein [Trifolium medium]
SLQGNADNNTLVIPKGTEIRVALKSGCFSTLRVIEVVIEELA